MEDDAAAEAPFGRPTHVPNDELRDKVKKAAAFGVPHTDIARRLRICVNTLRKYYLDELHDGVYDANEEVGGVMFDLATASPDPHVKFKASSYWLSRRAGWKEAGKDDPLASAKIQIEVTGGLPDRELKQVDAEEDGKDE